jgi:hypothetical protein
MTIQIKTKFLKSFIEAVTVKGNITDLQLKFTEEGVICNSAMSGNIGATFALLKIESFKEYETLESSVCISDTTILMNVLDLFGEEVNLELEGTDILKIYNDKKFAHLKLKNDDSTESIFPADKIESLLEKFDDLADIDVKILKNSVKNSTALGVSNYTLNCVDNILTITTGEDGFDKIQETVDFEYKNFTGKYEAIFNNVISIVPDKIQLSIIADNAPLMISFTTENYEVKIMIAPLAE